MKEKIFAIVVILLIITAVTTNTVKMDKDLDEIYDAIDTVNIDEGELEDAKRDMEAAYDLFRKRELFIALSVNHSALSNIEEEFAEMIGCLSVGDAEGAEVTKNRLLDALGHLRRLSGFNIDSII